MFPPELVSCHHSELPDSAGVVLVECPQGENSFQILAAKDCQNIRETVSANALHWASLCKRYLTYRVFSSENPTERQRVLLAVEAFRKTGR
jgi:hypothetical protein